MSEAMDPRELQRLRALYSTMDDNGLVLALYQGPEAYLTPEVWSIISQEASRRGIGVPNQEEIESHREAVRAEEDALQPPRLPWKWRLYLGSVGWFLMFAGWTSLATIVVSLVQRPEGWQADLRLSVAILVAVCVALVLLRLQVERLRDTHLPDSGATG